MRDSFDEFGSNLGLNKGWSPVARRVDWEVRITRAGTPAHYTLWFIIHGYLSWLSPVVVACLVGWLLFYD